MRRQQPQDSSFEEIDEHDQPTEPMMPVVIAPFAPTQVNGTAQPPPYPYLLPAPVKKKKQNGQRPAGGADATFLPPTSPRYPVYPAIPARAAKQVQPRQSLLPSLVGVFFVGVQLLLLVRFMLRLLSVSGNAKWLNLVYDVSDFFVFPFRLLLQNTALSLSVSVEVYTLLAILVYGLFSRILVRFLKALLNSR